MKIKINSEDVRRILVKVLSQDLDNLKSLRRNGHSEPDTDALIEAHKRLIEYNRV